MTVTFPSWLSKAADAIRRLADRPWTLFALILALNAVARPCSISAHDARLYSLQTLNQAEHGAYGDDVFLNYGSQDQFSLFSRVVAPMVSAFGLRWTFFFLYMVFNTLFVLGLFRLVRALIDDVVVSTLALIYLVTAPLSYGGHDIFMIHEQFFTPRVVGTALTLFALERLLSQRYLAALLLLLAGSVIHPLMAFGGVMIWIGCFAFAYLPTRWLIGITIMATSAGTILLSIPAWATPLFGSIDGEWHQMIRLAVDYNYPDTWTDKDWINLGVSFAVPIIACISLYRDDPVRRRFLLVVTLAGAVGFLTTVVASYLPYALLFQGQPYRVLWILKVLQIPLGFLIIARVGQAFQPDGKDVRLESLTYQGQDVRLESLTYKIAALALVGFFSITHEVPMELRIVAVMVPVSVLLLCVKSLTAPAPEELAVAAKEASETTIRQTVWTDSKVAPSQTVMAPEKPATLADSFGWLASGWWYAVARGFVLGSIVWTVYRWSFFFTERVNLSERFDLHEWVLFDLVGPMVWIVGFCLLALWLGRSLAPTRALLWASIAVAVLMPAAVFGLEINPAYQREHTRLGRDVALVRDFVAEHRDGKHKHPAIYSSLGRPDLLWIDVKATSYFDILQTAGVMFHRHTAEEIERRVLLVNKFEMDRQRLEELFPDEGKRAAMARLFRMKFEGPAPTQDDLARLCREPGLDYVVIRQEFPGLYSASNGRIFVYECEKVRRSLR